MTTRLEHQKVQVKDLYSDAKKTRMITFIFKKFLGSPKLYNKWYFKKNN
jgi:hypothetical protein